MILTCDQCQARYTVDDSRFGAAPRTVRCTSCGHKWRYEPSESVAPESAAAVAPAPKTQAEADVAVVRRFAAPARPAPKPPANDAIKRACILAASLAGPTILVLAVLLAVRGTLVAAWTPAARFYGAIGMPAPIAAPGLKVVTVRTEAKTEDGHRILLVEGELSNAGAAPRPAPILHASVTEGDTVKAHWTFAADSKELAPGQTVRFHTKLVDAPDGAGSVSVGVWR